MSDNEELRRLRRAAQDANPQAAAAAWARGFERDSIPLPTQFLASPDASQPKQRALRDAGALYRELVVAEPHGLTLTELRAAGYLGQERHDEALKVLCALGVVVEGRKGVDGFDTDCIFLRPVTTCHQHRKDH